MELGACLDRVRERRPLIHCITNYVTANDVANLLLACGASPIMADEPEEVEEITARCAGLCLNLGTPSRRTIPSLMRAGVKAGELGRPVVLDPVGVGASALRLRTAQELMARVPFTVLRGNVSELRALAGGQEHTRGVDAGGADAVTEAELERGVAFAKGTARCTGTVVAVTGAIDLVSDGEQCVVIRNGRPEMGLVTGTGCQLSALTAACLAASPEHPLEAAAAAVCAMGVAGELAWARMSPQDGNATYRDRIIDAVCRMDGAALEKGANYEMR
ncbi:hydroxyethylthiazole kinase [Clostridium phoceensis]|uniref:hydroxyethylthiazole kinase n=1 Tax=Clostridium phoceensis TaxID=1650661 RepID=UPI00067F7262|nr:hydroxyethylthiazole kinase [Clostridium phoceensis]